MTKEEVETVIGKPVASDPAKWSYQRTVSSGCTKYAGDKCAEPTQEVETEALSFTPNGHLMYEFRRGHDWLGKGCYSEPFFTNYYKPLEDKD